MTAIAELTKPSTTPSEAFALGIVEGAEALFSNPDFTQRMGVAPTRFSGPLVHGGHTLYFASEENQPSRTFKSRGASAATLQAEADGFECIVAASTGSHGISVGLAAARAGLHAIVHVPDSITRPKEELMRATGAEVIKEGSFLDAKNRAENDGSGLFVHPFAMPAVRDGQGTFGLGLIDFMLTKGLTGHDGEVVVPVAVAGGGHILGVATVIWDAKRRGLLGEGVKVIGVQPKNNNTAMRAREKIRANQEPAGLYGRLERQDPGVDALFIDEASLNPDNLALLADTTFVERFCTLTPKQIGEALLYLARHGLEGAEPAGALPTAFALAYARKYPYFQRGGNAPHTTFVLPVSGLNGSKESNTPFMRAATNPPALSLRAQLDASRRSQRHSTR